MIGSVTWRAVWRAFERLAAARVVRVPAGAYDVAFLYALGAVVALLAWLAVEA